MRWLTRLDSATTPSMPVANSLRRVFTWLAASLRAFLMSLTEERKLAVLRAACLERALFRRVVAAPSLRSKALRSLASFLYDLPNMSSAFFSALSRDFLRKERAFFWAFLSLLWNFLSSRVARRSSLAMLVSVASSWALSFLLVVSAKALLAFWDPSTASAISRLIFLALRAILALTSLRWPAEYLWAAAALLANASIFFTLRRMAASRLFLATEAADLVAYFISTSRSLRALADSRARASTLSVVCFSRRVICSVRRWLVNQRVSLSILDPRCSTSWARFSPVAMAFLMESLSSSLLRFSMIMSCLRPAADFWAFFFTMPVSLKIFFSATASFLATVRPRAEILARKAFLARNTASMASRRMRRVAASRALFFLRWAAWLAASLAYRPEVALRRRDSACLRSRARVALTLRSLPLKSSAMRSILRVVSAWRLLMSFW